MTVHSGKFGVVNGQSTVRNWTVNDLQEPQPFVASNTKAGTGRRVGIYDWTGSFGNYGGQPNVMPGDAFAFSGLTAPDTDVQGTTGVTYDGLAMVDSVVITWNWGAGEILSYVVNFSGDGELTNSSAILSDVTVPDVPIIADTNIEYETVVPDTFTAWLDLAQAVLTLTTANQPYVNSGTIQSGKVVRRRVKGITDFTIAITDQANERTGLPDLGDDLRLRMFINATEFYELQWGQLTDYSGILTDIETGAIIQRTANVGMNGYDDTGTEGTIILPDLTVWWPTP